MGSNQIYHNISQATKTHNKQKIMSRRRNFEESKKAKFVDYPNFRSTTKGLAFNVNDVETGPELPALNSQDYQTMWEKLDVKSSASNSKTDELYKGFNNWPKGTSKTDQLKDNEVISCEPVSSFLLEGDHARGVPPTFSTLCCCWDQPDQEKIVALWQVKNQHGYTLKKNILAEAAMLAYGQHYPLRLSPDVFWLTIMKTVAGHINDNAEKFRSKFVSHEGKKDLTIDIGPSFPSTPEGWKSHLPTFSNLIAENIKDAQLRDLMECNFTSTTPIDAAVSRITLMDAMQSYFSYGMRTCCGIPYIELLGEKSDWEKLQDKAEKILTTLDMEWWLTELRPILAEFVNAATGNIDLKFWANIAQKHVGFGSGATTDMEGWLCKFFPKKSGNEKWYVCDRMEIKQIPTHISMAPLTLKNESDEIVLETVLAGGVVVLTQNKESLALEPRTSWSLIAKNKLA